MAENCRKELASSANGLPEAREGTEFSANASSQQSNESEDVKEVAARSSPAPKEVTVKERFGSRSETDKKVLGAMNRFARDISPSFQQELERTESSANASSQQSNGSGAVKDAVTGSSSVPTEQQLLFKRDKDFDEAVKAQYQQLFEKALEAGRVDSKLVGLGLFKGHKQNKN